MLVSARGAHKLGDACGWMNIDRVALLNWTIEFAQLQCSLFHWERIVSRGCATLNFLNSLLQLTCASRVAFEFSIGIGFGGTFTPARLDFSNSLLHKSCKFVSTNWRIVPRTLSWFDPFGKRRVVHDANPHVCFWENASNVQLRKFERS